MRTLMMTLVVALVAQNGEATDEYFREVWMRGFLKLQAAQKKEEAGLHGSAIDGYLEALDHYRSMRYYRTDQETSRKLEERIQLLAMKVNSMGADPYASRSSLFSGPIPSVAPGSSTAPRGDPAKVLVPEGLPSNWETREDGSVIVPLVQTPETRKYYEEKVRPLLRGARYGYHLLSER